MQIGIILLALSFPLLELAVIIKVGQAFGVGSTILLLVGMAILGGVLVQQQGMAAARRAMESVGRGEPPIGPVADSMFIMLAGTLLLIPGFLSDVAGLLLLIPPLRRAFARWLLQRLMASGRVHVSRQEWRRDGQGPASGPGSGPGVGPDGGTDDGVVIEGEWRRVDDPAERRPGGPRSLPEDRSSGPRRRDPP